MPTSDTKSTILDAAEALFSEQGFAATSMRELTQRAGVNLAAVNYHFGSKDDLIREVLRRIVEPVNEERRRRLDAMEAPTLEDVVRAFLEPALAAVRDDAGLRAPAPPGGAPAGRLARIFGRVMVEQHPALRSFFTETFGDLLMRFVHLFQQTAPAIDEQTAWLRLHFTAGAMAHVLQNADAIQRVSRGACRADDPTAVVDQLVTYAIGGFAAEAR
jgi:AcrR family transcriptional regulator